MNRITWALLPVIWLALDSSCSVAAESKHTKLVVINYSEAIRVMKGEQDPSGKCVLQKMIENLGTTPAVAANAIETYFTEIILKFIGDETTKLYRHLAKIGKIEDQDADNIKKIIAAGKEQGVDEMDIVVNHEQFEGIKANLPPSGGQNISFNIGGGGKTQYQIHVKYKD